MQSTVEARFPDRANRRTAHLLMPASEGIRSREQDAKQTVPQPEWVMSFPWKTSLRIAEKSRADSGRG
jgi:hypothetical protein